MSFKDCKTFSNSRERVLLTKFAYLAKCLIHRQLKGITIHRSPSEKELLNTGKRSKNSNKTTQFYYS